MTNWLRQLIFILLLPSMLYPMQEEVKQKIIVHEITNQMPNPPQNVQHNTSNSETEKYFSAVGAYHHVTTTPTVQSVIDNNNADLVYTTASFFALASSLPLEAISNPYYLATSIQALAVAPALYAAYRISVRTFSYLYRQCFDEVYETDSDNDLA